MCRAAIQQRDLRGDAKLQQRCLEHIRAAAGDLQDVRPMVSREACERLPK